jgi:hypothetical protein
MKCRFAKYDPLLILICMSFFSATAQPEKKKVSLKDSLDSKFDVSDHLIEANGFIPVPYIVTEPALGGFGVALFPIFIKKRPPYLDTVKGELHKTPVQPDVTGGGGIYTVNKTWGTFAFRSGTLIKQRIKYLGAGGYVHLNMSFYKTIEQVGEREFKFTIDAVPMALQATKRIGFSHWYAGLKYLFLKTNISFNGDTAIKSYVDSADLDKLVSQLGIIVEMDKRDNIFTPDRGLKIHFDVTRSDDAIGSDYDFWRMNLYSYWYQPVFRNTVLGLRFDGKQAYGDPPFYMVPFVEMRGVPAERYQGRTNLLTEMEFRKDIKTRWSLMLYGGTAKAFDEWDEFGDAKWIFTYGSGFRYLLARKFKLRMGIDVAHGPGTWAYYIVFGSNWLK